MAAQIYGHTKVLLPHGCILPGLCRDVDRILLTTPFSMLLLLYSNVLYLSSIIFFDKDFRHIDP